MMIAWAFLSLSTDPVLTVEIGCDELEVVIWFEVVNGLADVPAVAFCSSIAAIPSRPCL